MKHASLPLLLFLCRCRQRKVKINEIVKFKFLAGTTRCQTTNNSSCGLRVVPHFSWGIVERAKRERAWKSPHARQSDTRVSSFLTWGDFHASSRFVALLSLRKNGGLLVVYRNCCLGLYIFVKGFRRANKQPRPQGFSLKKWVGRPTHFLREKPWERGWANKQRGLYPRELIHNGIEKALRNKPWQCWSKYVLST